MSMSGRIMSTVTTATDSSPTCVGCIGGEDDVSMMVNKCNMIEEENDVEEEGECLSVVESSPIRPRNLAISYTMISVDDLKEEVQDDIYYVNDNEKEDGEENHEVELKDIIQDEQSSPRKKKRGMKMKSKKFMPHVKDIKKLKNFIPTIMHTAGDNKDDKVVEDDLILEVHDEGRDESLPRDEPDNESKQSDSTCNEPETSAKEEEGGDDDEDCSVHLNPTDIFADEPLEVEDIQTAPSDDMVEMSNEEVGQIAKSTLEDESNTGGGTSNKAAVKQFMVKQNAKLKSFISTRVLGGESNDCDESVEISLQDNHHQEGKKVPSYTKLESLSKTGTDCNEDNVDGTHTEVSSTNQDGLEIVDEMSATENKMVFESVNNANDDNEERNDEIAEDEENNGDMVMLGQDFQPLQSEEAAPKNADRSHVDDDQLLDSEFSVSNQEALDNAESPSKAKKIQRSITKKSLLAAKVSADKLEQMKSSLVKLKSKKIFLSTKVSEEHNKQVKDDNSDSSHPEDDANQDTANDDTAVKKDIVITETDKVFPAENAGDDVGDRQIINDEKSLKDSALGSMSMFGHKGTKEISVPVKSDEQKKKKPFQYQQTTVTLKFKALAGVTKVSSSSKEHKVKPNESVKAVVTYRRNTIASDRFVSTHVSESTGMNHV